MGSGINGGSSGGRAFRPLVGGKSVNGTSSAGAVNRARGQVASVTSDSCEAAFNGLTPEQQKLVVKGVKMELYHRSLKGLRGS